MIPPAFKAIDFSVFLPALLSDLLDTVNPLGKGESQEIIERGGAFI